MKECADVINSCEMYIQRVIQRSLIDAVLVVLSMTCCDIHAVSLISWQNNCALSSAWEI